MSVLNSFKFVSYQPINNSSKEVTRRRKLIVKIEEQLALADNPKYQPMHYKKVKDTDGNEQKIEVPKRVKRWWSATANGKINLTIRYGSKPIQFAKDKNAIELDSEEQVAVTLLKIKDAVQAGELDKLIEQHAQYGRGIKSKTGSK